MKRNFAPINAQHAPPPWQAWPLGALQIASINAQRMTGGIATAIKAIASSVRIELKTLLNRLARSQPTTPVVPRCGACTATGRSWAMSAIGSALHQRHGAVVGVHNERDRQADKE